MLRDHGAEASVPLSVFGLITPLPDPDHFAMPWKLLGHPTREESPSFDGLLREALPKRRSVEHILSLSRFPNVTIQPIAVYRSLQRRRRHTPEKLANE